MVNLYTDNETSNILKEIRDKDPDFNLAGFVKTALINKEGIGSMISEIDILKNIDDSKNNLKNAEDKVSHWERVYQDFKVNQEIKKKEEEDKKMEAQEKYEKETQKMKNVKDTFKEEMGRGMSDFEFEEYEKEGKNIWGFCDMLKERLEGQDKIT